MKGKTIFGALLVSVALCSQGFGFELLDRMLGLNCGGCGECNACAKVACCEKACCRRARLLREACVPERPAARTGLLRKGRACGKCRSAAAPRCATCSRHEGPVRGQGLLLRDQVLRAGQGLLPGTGLLREAPAVRRLAVRSRCRTKKCRKPRARRLRRLLPGQACCEPACAAGHL